MAESRTKIARELSAEELEEFCALLAKEPRLTGKRLMELAAERGVRVGHDSANTFLNQEFKPYLEKLSRRRRLVQFLDQNTDGKEASRIADAAAGELSQATFEFLSVLDLDIDMQSEEGMERAKDLSLIISRIRRGDHTQRALEEKIKDMEADRAEREREREAMKDALNKEATRKGVSQEAQNELRKTLGMDPLPAAA